MTKKKRSAAAERRKRLKQQRMTTEQAHAAGRAVLDLLARRRALKEAKP